MTKTTRIGLIGTGRIGQVHARSISELDHVELAWACDPFIAGAEALAARHGSRATADAAEVFADSSVDGVIIATPTSTHVDLIEQAISAGIPALCEKPIDLDMTRVDSIRDRVREAGVFVGLGFNRRFDPHFAELHRRVQLGDIGRLEQLSIISRDPAEQPAEYVATSGGIFRDMTIHDLDMARFFVPEIVEVTARGFNSFSGTTRELGDFDGAAVTLRGSHEELITITNSRHSAYGYDQRLEAFGSRGLLSVSNIAETVVRHSNDTLVEARQPYLNFFLERYRDAYRLELEEFISGIHGAEVSTPDFEDGRAALLLADAAEESARTGQSVAVDLS